MNVALLAAIGTLVVAGCAPDLRETLGPLVPIPNLTGRVARAGEPVFDRKVKLEIPDADTTLAEDRTDAAGRYEFTAVPAGTWLLKVTSSDPGDFATVTCEVAVAGEEAPTEAPELDLSLRGVEPKEPGDGEERRRPNPVAPVEFKWSRPQDAEREVQVRVYDADGAPVWFSTRLTEELVRWNGVGNHGDYLNRLAPAGTFTWKLRVEAAGTSLEYTTGPRTLILKE